ncbi:hypothetical protein HS048_01415 [Planomonospora sp. ID91781]|nr:hypothetical protein [Planomonospora sp. ID91781]MBG0819424.1 hypothetical protein [Planomonospora sp. ID91781]
MILISDRPRDPGRNSFKGRYPEGSDLERTWAEGARAFADRRASTG